MESSTSDLVRERAAQRRELAARRPPREECNLRLLPARLEFERSWEGLDPDESASEDALRSALQAVLNSPVRREFLNPETLLDLERSLQPAAAATFREQDAKPLTPSHLPLPPAGVAAAVERFFEWVRSPAFGELAPAAQMALVQVRLCEIHPFQQHARLLASLFSSTFALAGGVLLPVPDTAERDGFQDALEAALGFSTEPLIRWNLTACLRSYQLLG